MDQRSIVVTGGFGALGRVETAAFASRRDKVARIDYATRSMDEIVGVLDLGGVDLTDEDSALTAVNSVLANHGGLDVLVNVAGGFTWETLFDGSIFSWRRMFDMNFVTVATITKAALPAVKASCRGRIINIGAGAAIKAEAGMGAYAASKASVHRMTESLAAELAGDGVTVNAVLPSIIDTPANRADMPEADFAQWVQPEAISDVILFLASPAARAISGALIPVTRGG